MSNSMTTIDPLGGYQGEALAVSLPVLVVIMVASLVLLFLFVLLLWRWDVKQSNGPLQGLELRIDEFVRAVAAWDFEAAERAATHAIWSSRGQDSA